MMRRDRSSCWYRKVGEGGRVAGRSRGAVGDGIIVVASGLVRVLGSIEFWGGRGSGEEVEVELIGRKLMVD